MSFFYRYAQLLASLQAWSQWVAQKPDRDRLLLSQRLADSCIWIISQNLTVTSPPIIVHAATHLLQTITAILKPNLWGKNVFITMIHTVEFANFKSDTARVLRRALVNGIILPQGDHNERHKLLSSYFYLQLLEKCSYCHFFRFNGADVLEVIRYGQSSSCFRVLYSNLDDGSERNS